MWYGFYCSLAKLELSDFKSLGALVAHLTDDELIQLKSNVSETFHTFIGAALEATRQTIGLLSNELNKSISLRVNVIVITLNV